MEKGAWNCLFWCRNQFSNVCVSSLPSLLAPRWAATFSSGNQPTVMSQGGTRWHLVKASLVAHYQIVPQGGTAFCFTLLYVHTVHFRWQRQKWTQPWRRVSGGKFARHVWSCRNSVVLSSVFLRGHVRLGLLLPIVTTSTEFHDNILAPVCF